MAVNNKNIDKDSPVPAYYQIELHLRNRISQNEWGVDKQIPSEAELSRQYEVSRVTIRQALAELEKNGIIKRIRGKGAFINSNPTPFVHDLSYFLLSSERLNQKGIFISAKLLEFDLLTDPFPYVYETLHIRPDSQVIFVKRLFTLDEKPIAISRSWISHSLVPGFHKMGLKNNKLSATLAEKYGLVPVRVEDYIELVRSTPAESKLLKTNYDTPLLLLKGVSYLEDGKPLEYSNTLWLGDCVRFHLTLNNSPNGFVLAP